jgi:hypothetical protein
MIRTAIKLCLMIALVPGVCSGAAAEAKRPAESAPPPAYAPPTLQLTLQRLVIDPAGTIAGAFRCACLRDFLAPAAATSVPAPAPLLSGRGVVDPVSVEPILIEDKPGVRIRIRW